MPDDFDFSKGFVPRQMADVQRGINEKMSGVRDPKTGEYPFQSWTDDTIAQQFAAIIAEAIARTENAAAELADWRDPKTARDVGLSHLVQINAIQRKNGAGAILKMRLIGDGGTVIPAGTRFGNADGSRVFETNLDAYIDKERETEVLATCTTFGLYAPEPGEVSAMLTAIPGLASAQNVETVSEGAEEETDEELRRRQQQSTNATSYRQIEAIRAAVYNITGVTFCRAYQNSGLETDERGIPGKSISLVVKGGDDDAIADALYYRVPIGIGYHGDTAVNVRDRFGLASAVRFQRPIEKPIHVRLTLSIVVDENIQAYPSNGDALIKAAIVDYAKNGHPDNDLGGMGNGAFVPGADIIRSYLYSAVNTVAGVRIVKLELADKKEERSHQQQKEGAPDEFETVSVEEWNFAEHDISIAWNEQGVFAAENIEITYQ